MIVEVREAGGIRRMTWEEFEEAARDGAISPERLIRIEVLTGARFVPAGEFEFFQGLVRPELVRFRRTLRTPGMPLATAVLVGLQVQLYLLVHLPGAGDWLVTRLTNWTPAVLERGEVHRLFTYGLLHLSFPHLAFNLLFLAYVGWNLERGFGRANMVAVFAGSVLAGGLLSVLAGATSPSLGASGGDFGLLAAAVVFGWKHADLLPRSAHRLFGPAILPYLVVSLLSGLHAAARVDNWGHLGGLACGTVLATVLEPPTLARNAARNSRRLRHLAILAALSLAAPWAAGPRLVRLVPAHEDGLQWMHPAWWPRGWTPAGEPSAASPVTPARVVARTSTHGSPLDLDEAVEFLRRRAGRGGEEARVVHRKDGAWEDGWPGSTVLIEVVRPGRPVASALVLARVAVRGRYVHRVGVELPPEPGWREVALARRLLDHSRLVAPDALRAARERAHHRPDDPLAWTALARAALRTGLADEASRAARRAMEGASRTARREARLALLEVFAETGSGIGPEELETLADPTADDVEFLLAAADAWERAGRADRVVEALDRAALLAPGDRRVLRARAARGLATPPAAGASSARP